jgi:tryptophan synthase beta subunit
VSHLPKSIYDVLTDYRNHTGSHKINNAIGQVGLHTRALLV